MKFKRAFNEEYIERCIEENGPSPRMEEIKRAYAHIDELERKLAITTEALKECADYSGFTNSYENINHVVKEALKQIGVDDV